MGTNNIVTSKKSQIVATQDISLHASLVYIKSCLAFYVSKLLGKVRDGYK